jgi:hypothetical protein
VGDLSRTRLWAAMIVILAGALAAAHLGMARAQINEPIGTQIPQSVGPIGNSDRHGMPDDVPFATREIQERQMKRLRQEHQQELLQDTTRLVQLATTLKADVDKETQPTEPTNLLKEADEISKLAKKVSDRIKTQ